MAAKKSPDPQGSLQGTPQDAPLVSSIDDLKAQAAEAERPKKKGSHG